MQEYWGLWTVAGVTLLFMINYFHQRHKHRQTMSNFSHSWGEKSAEDKWDAVLESTPLVPPPDVIILSILPSGQTGFSCGALKNAFQETNLLVTSQHTYQRLDLEQNVSFQVLSMVEPGSFDFRLPLRTLPGIVLLLVLSKHPNPQEAFEDMKITAERLAYRLSGSVCDAARKPITAKKLGEYQKTVGRYTETA